MYEVIKITINSGALDENQFIKIEYVFVTFCHSYKL